MSKNHELYTYLEDGISFKSKDASRIRTIYLPLCGTTSSNIKSSITPFLSGDIKVNKFKYLTKPMSTEDLRYDSRNFFVLVDNGAIHSLTNVIKDSDSHVEAGLLWHRLVKKFSTVGIEFDVLNFVPASGDNVELMKVSVKNISLSKISIAPTAVIPIFARALANKHDHEHVTSLLHRTIQKDNGVIVEPPMAFNEEGHLPNETTYFVLGADCDGVMPLGTFPTVDSFYGEYGNLTNPKAVIDNEIPKKLSDVSLQGKEIVGAIRFKDCELNPGQKKEFIVVMGIVDDGREVENIFNRYNTLEKFDVELEKVKKYWLNKANAISFYTVDNDFNSWMHWVTIQPVLRRIFGCSFLPDHDYGKGGKGWRDIWQDLLSLILIEPDQVRDVLINNFAGVRIDGSNATIIGDKPGEFVADRNAITRVWMDHGVWPLLTLLLYINQTGDFDILTENNTYFRDMQLSRAHQKDSKWNASYGMNLKDDNGNVYNGTLIEHLLVQHLVQFFNVGEHNVIRLESADWNDGLDMAHERGESVAFSALYGGNLFKLADLIEAFAEKKQIKTISLLRELSILLDTVGKNKINYAIVQAKKDLLYQEYFGAVQPEISGDKIDFDVESICQDLRKKGAWIFDHIKNNEKIDIETNGNKYSWFNGYYDNSATRVEGLRNSKVWMTLTGQVFPVMSGLADENDIKDVVSSVREFLKDKQLGGFKLNTDFGLDHYLDLGRAFGFALGTKENGAFFSHMTVMYAYALYERGFAKEGFEVLHSIYNMCMDTDKSRIYPGIPEYMDLEGKGMYHYLTGSASWYVLTLLTQVFGVKGEFGDLVLYPKLVLDEFGKNKKVSVSFSFAGKKMTVNYVNSKNLDYGVYKIKDVKINSSNIDFIRELDNKVKIERSLVEKLKDLDQIDVYLD